MRTPERLAVTYLRIGALNELQYRVNFFLSIVQSLVAVGTALVVLALVFSHTDSLGGWSSDELLVVMGVYVLIGGVIRSVIQPNMQQLMADVQKGTLDGLLTKPADAQLLVSIRRFGLWQAVDVLVGLLLIGIALIRLEQGVDVLVGAALVVVGLVRVGRPVSVGAVLAFALTLALGVVVLYCFWLLLTVTAFWIVRVDVLVELFDGLYQAGRWPVGIYPGWLRIAFTFLLPLAFAITVPASALTRGVSGWVLLGVVAFTAALFTVTRVVWRSALRHYTGASA